MLKKRIVLAAIPILIAVLLFAMGAMSQRQPKTLGVIAGQLAECGDRPNCVSSQTPSVSARVAPLVFADAPQMAWDRVRAAIASMPGARVITDRDGYMHVEFRSQLFRFVDDLELLMDEANSKIDVRSAARIGYSDLGANRRRVELLRICFSDMASEISQ